MLIRSQDKESIMNLDNIMRLSIIIPPCGINERMITGNGAELGTYSTKEKAIKVLDMIQNKYFEHMTAEFNGVVLQILERPKVFQMPQDSEV